jgi:hypothetical protein
MKDSIAGVGKAVVLLISGFAWAQEPSAPSHQVCTEAAKPDSLPPAKPPRHRVAKSPTAAKDPDPQPAPQYDARPPDPRPAEPPEAQRPPAGRWRYTPQYGWVWVPQAARVYSAPHAYYPRWVAPPWGWGGYLYPRPYIVRPLFWW